MVKQDYRKHFILSDIIASAAVWSMFFLYRKVFIETVKFGVPVPFHPDFNFFSGLLLIPLFWFLLHYSSGAYYDIRRKTFVKSATQLFSVTVAGVVVIFFLAILDDTVISYRTYYQSFLLLFTLQYSVTLFFRSFLFLYRNSRFALKRDQFRVVMFGKASMFPGFLEENARWLKKNNFDVIGFVSDDESLMTGNISAKDSPVTKLVGVIENQHAEEVFVVSESTNREYLEMILLQLFRKDITIRILPEVYPAATMPVRITDIMNAPLLLVSKDILPSWQQSIKVFFDMVLSAGALLLLLPLTIVLVVIIKTTSAGPVIYTQQRIGKNGRPFRIIKFRSMYVDAETEGPQLASPNDSRITPIGRFMRKRRLDEIPNFLNVLKGDMSLVGPRPERAYYIDQIIDKAPQYAKLHLVKPGITSWGQVKYGYAGNIDMMIRRMRYDLVYIENMSLFVDMQILFKTIGIIIRGQGM
jgi:exopolysaccharide biosynthesis polyprenyl glycosylphosphotransferase